MRVENNYRDGLCLVIRAGHGVKTQWLMPDPKSLGVQLTLWYRVPEGAVIVVNSALFRESRWIERYTDVAALDTTDHKWKKLETTFTLSHPDASHFNLEFTACINGCRVAEINVRPLSTDGV